ncbi:MAG: GTPase domain-containing protein, partial [Planctomycetia bacterium]|nr:GTPase domain-containing protein [Planctomycetia bacterium]
MIPNILVCGKTGAGKTSLIQAVSKSGLVPDSAIGHGQPTTRGFVLYHTDDVNFIDAEGMEGGKQTKQQYLDFLNSEIKQRSQASVVEDMVHVNWYCIDGVGGRVQNVDQQLINELGESTIVVITKSDGIRANQLEPLFEAIKPCVGNDMSRIRCVSNQEKHQAQLRQLMDQTKILAERQAQLSKQ